MCDLSEPVKGSGTKHIWHADPLIQGHEVILQAALLSQECAIFHVSLYWLAPWTHININFIEEQAHLRKLKALLIVCLIQIEIKQCLVKGAGIIWTNTLHSTINHLGVGFLLTGSIWYKGIFRSVSLITKFLLNLSPCLPQHAEGALSSQQPEVPPLCTQAWPEAQLSHSSLL